MTTAIPDTFMARAGQIIDRHIDVRDIRSIVALAIMETEQRHRLPLAGLTSRQAEALKFIDQYQSLHECSPSFEELREALGLAAKSGVHRIIEQLVDRGRLIRMPGRARSLQIAVRAA